MILVPWVTYLVIQAIDYSGIVGIMSCGIAMARYATPNLPTNVTKVTFTI